VADKDHRVAWILERDVFPSSHALLEEAVIGAGQRVVLWDDEWWSTRRWPPMTGAPVIFRGSLANAEMVRTTLPWRPGAYCDVNAFRCSAWYPRAAEWLVHRQWRVLPADALVADGATALEPLGNPSAVFVRPDSPLKPFAGRVLPIGGLSLASLDHG